MEDSGPRPGSWAAGWGRGAGIRRTLLPVILVSSYPPPSAHPQPTTHPPGPGPSSHIKPSLCQAGGREPRRAAGGGEEEVAHTAREHLEAFEGGPAATRPGVGSSEEQPPPSRRPAPSPGPSFPATAPCATRRRDPLAPSARGMADFMAKEPPQGSAMAGAPSPHFLPLPPPLVLIGVGTETFLRGQFKSLAFLNSPLFLGWVFGGG